MHSRISFMTANFVGREVGYLMKGGWGEGDTATQNFFRPLATFSERFGAMLSEVQELGFSAIDLWGAHLHPEWATLEHIALAKNALKERQMTIHSFAGFAGDETGFRALARLCAEMNVRIIGGGGGLIKANRALLVSIAREFGVVYAYENHPERSAAEVLAIIGEGDEDVIGVAIDTGWFGTQNFDGVTACRELASRIKLVHLKDVKAPRAEKTGFGLIDMGHETCRFKEGIVPVDEIVAVLEAAGYRGTYSIEHEPEEYDPREDCKVSGKMAAEWLETAASIKKSPDPLRIAVVGCGNIANGYGSAMLTHGNLKIMGAFDLDATRAEAWTKEFGGRIYETIETLLNDPEVECVVNLTIHQAHYEVIKQCLEAGKHVHTEKPLTAEVETAQELVGLAASKGLRLSCAPVTWLGESPQTAWKCIRDGAIGTPRIAYANVDWGRIESWHPNPAPFYAVGPVFDVAVYPLALLTAWFGPVESVIAGGGIILPERETKESVPFTLDQHDWTTSILTFKSGLLARITANFYVGQPADRRDFLEVHGDSGSLRTTWLTADSKLEVGEFGGTYKRVQLVRDPTPGIDWGRGVAELGAAIRENRPHPTSGAQGAHIVEVVAAVHESIRTGKAVKVLSTFDPPAPLDWAK